ncbi:hypothetical protein PENDEC_c024G06922 [Penicillium decumbens]|uniref:Uncharacterized protein n=1 Tax=Penicillium decumbens TaxID=69771 RepID=A0A1V6P0J7_PENDC|nr:hypothetical protein PENDEC_c024G06922 [Penicillium decumbens]
MALKRQKPHPELQVPVPTFPLSSPISEEISSPSCSSAEDRELERTRPFDYLVKATRQKLETRSGSGRDGLRSPNLSHRDRNVPDSSRTPRLSIRGITKKKKNAAKIVGLNVVTDFPVGTAAESNSNSDAPAAAPFVDLNDLKLLSKAREKERFARKFKTAERRNLDTAPAASSRGLQQLPETVESNHNPFIDPNLENPFNRHDHGLSPSDRHVMIGLEVPRHESSDRTRDLDSAGDQHTPLTPSIIVTPAREDAPWSTSSPEMLRPRAASSVYSQPTPLPWASETDIPPVPVIPVQHSAESKSKFGPYFLNAHAIAAGREQKRRSVSADTIIEDDSPEQEHSHSRTIDDDRAPLTKQGLGVDTEARPQSQGWWTYLLSPLLGKKSPLSPDFPRQNPSSPATTKGKEREWWEKKEVSCFSPETPDTTMTEWWNDDKDKDPKSPGDIEQSRSLGVDDDTAFISRTNRQTTSSFMLGGRSIQGEAAEYYQACAHELFSKTPYFECYNHVCSITPAAVVASRQREADATGDRGLVFAGADIQDSGVPGVQEKANGETGTAPGLLIDVGSPISEGPKYVGHDKSASPTSSPDSDGWTSISDDHEKGLPEPSKDVPRDVAPEPQPVPVPMSEPTPAPAVQGPASPPLEMPRELTPAPVTTPAPAPVPVLPQVINNYHYPPAPAPIQPQTATVERAMPQYVPVFPPHNGMPEPQPMPQEPVSDGSKAPHVPQPQLSPSVRPWQKGSVQEPPHEPEAQVRGMSPLDSTPISPAFQRAAGGPGSIPLSEVNAPAPAYTQYPRDAPLPPRYDLHPAPGAGILNPTGMPGPGETRRRRLEREDAAGRKLGGLWRGRGCSSNKGCFGRPGREGRLKRRWYFAICSIFSIIVILAIVLAITLTHKGDTTLVQSAWLNLTGYPPMPTGIATIAGSETQSAKSTCISPSTLWSCSLPHDQQSGNKPYSADNPSFRVEIQFRNGTYDNGTDTINSTSARKFRRGESSLFTPDPDAPSIADQAFIGNTTDGNSVPYAGEETPFYMSILSPIHLSSTSLFRRSSGTITTNLTKIIPAPDENSDGTAAAAELYPLPDSQPVRLYNRGQSDEHYGFYTFYDKSIFLASRAALDGSVVDTDPNDQNGGVSKSTAKVRCTWSQTRFLVQIWTQSGKMGYNLLSPSNTSSAMPTSTSTATSSSSATDYTRPGSFPYPVTITVDRHGGEADKKLVYCYAIEDGHYNITDRKLQAEYRGVGGTWINPANGDDVKADSMGGIDGGTGGCGCQWVNWISTL